MPTEVPAVLRSLPARRLLELHRKHHGLAAIARPQDEGLPIRRGEHRVATLQASGPDDTIAMLQLALQGLLEVEQVGRQRHADLSARLEILHQRIQKMEGELDDNIRQRTRALVRQNKRLQSAANTDPLTSLLNRRALDRALREISADAAKEPMSVAVLMVDLDHFKRINDTRGHLVGDAVLAEVARVLRKRCRKGDIVGRWGGEEFLVVLPCCPIGPAHRIAEELRRTVARLRVEAAPDLGITASFGVAGQELGHPGAPTLVELVAEADRRLYVAKHAGRNRVVGDPGGAQQTAG